jgi:5-formyltetrahydrofolate cyclo-ligase
LHDLSQLRRIIRAQRCSLTSKQQLSNSSAASKILTRSALFRNSKNIAIYLETDGEIAISQLPALIARNKKTAFLPVLRPMQPNRLWFAEYRHGDKLICNKYKIPEPDIRKHKPIPPHSLDLVLVPLVAFDYNCNRVGMGGGFYDRTFHYLKNRNVWNKPKLIGVAHELQRVKTIQTNRWDIPLDGVITESNFYMRDNFVCKDQIIDNNS